MEDDNLIDELSDDFDDPYCTDSLTAEQKDFADDIISVFDEFLTSSLFEEFTSYPNLVHHFDEHCLGNEGQKESSYKNVYYDFKTLKQYDHYEQAFCNDIKMNAVYLDSLYDKDVVSKAFREFFEGGKCLVLTASCGFKNKQGSVSIALRSFSSNVTLNYKGGNTIDLAVQSYFPKTISLYPIDSWRLEARLNGIINKYNGNSDKIGKVLINNPKERRGNDMDKKSVVKEATDKDAILKRKDELIAKRKKIVDAATKRQHGTGYWHLVSTDFTKEEQNELDEISKELGSLLSDWAGLHDEKLKESRKQTAVKSNGVYSVLNGKWVKEPVANDIPNIDNDAFESLFKEWEDKYFNLIESESKTKEDIIDLIEDLYDLRKSSIAEDGEYGLGNLVFKEMRSMGYLDNLREIKKEISSKELSLEGLDESFAINELDTLEKIRALKLPKDNATFTRDDDGTIREVHFPDGYQVSFFRPEIGNHELKATLNAIGGNLGDVYLGRFEGESELSYHFDDYDKAMRFAEIFNQQCIYGWLNDDFPSNKIFDEKKMVDYPKAIGELKKFFGR